VTIWKEPVTIEAIVLALSAEVVQIRFQLERQQFNGAVPPSGSDVVGGRARRWAAPLPVRCLCG
jgi:hypothetical protein